MSAFKGRKVTQRETDNKSEFWPYSDAPVSWWAAVEYSDYFSAEV